MIKNKTKIEKFSKETIKRELFSYRKALAIFEGLYKEALSLKVINKDNILDGIEVDIRVAKTLNELP